MPITHSEALTRAIEHSEICHDAPPFARSPCQRAACQHFANILPRQTGGKC